MREITGYTRTGYKKNTDYKVTPVLDKMQDYGRYWMYNVNRMSGNRLPRIIKTAHEKAEGTTEETSGNVRQDRVNKWPSSMMMMMMVVMNGRPA